MAIPPTIPTSFVPKQPVNTAARRPKSGSNLFLLISLGIAGISVLAAGGTFGYKLYLENVRTAKAAELEAAEEAINMDTVEDFIRLRNRLVSAQTLLNQHVYLSQFFDVLEANTLQTVRFNSLAISVADDRSAEITMDGVARSFNALAAQSEALATERRIKRAIFSSITVNTNGTVAFKLSAEIDPRLIVSSDSPTPAAAQPTTPNVLPLAPTSPSTSTPATATPKPVAPTPGAAPQIP